MNDPDEPVAWNFNLLIPRLPAKFYRFIGCRVHQFVLIVLAVFILMAMIIVTWLVGSLLTWFLPTRYRPTLDTYVYAVGRLEKPVFYACFALTLPIQSLTLAQWFIEACDGLVFGT